MKDIYIYDNRLLKEVYLQDGPNWQRRRDFASPKDLADYLNSQEPEAVALRERGKVAIHLSGSNIKDLEAAIAQVKFRKSPQLSMGAPPGAKTPSYEKSD